VSVVLGHQGLVRAGSYFKTTSALRSSVSNGFLCYKYAAPMGLDRPVRKESSMNISPLRGLFSEAMQYYKCGAPRGGITSPYGDSEHGQYLYPNIYPRRLRGGSASKPHSARPQR